VTRILLIEDDALIRATAYKFLESSGHEVVEAENGAEALEINQLGFVDLVITDIMMPEKDGIQTIREIRSTHPFLPIIVITGGGGNAVLKGYFSSASLKLGVKQVLLKPFTQDDLLAVVDRVLKQELTDRSSR